MKNLLFTSLMMSSFIFVSYAQSARTESHVLHQSSQPVKFTAHITRVTQFKGTGKTTLFVKSNEYKQTIRLIISDTQLEPTATFFTGEYIAVTGHIRLRKDYHAICITNASQIKPILVDNVVGSGGFN